MMVFKTWRLAIKSFKVLAVLIVVSSCTEFGSRISAVHASLVSDCLCGSKSWAGWAYLENGTDFPFRFRVKDDGMGGLDIAAANLFGAELTDVKEDGTDVSFAWRVRDDDTRTFTGTNKNGYVTGSIDWQGTLGTFQMNCAERSIAAVDVSPNHIRPGFYLFQDDDDASKDIVWLVERAGYGETFVRDVSDGEQRVIFPHKVNDYFLGSALFDPSVVSKLLKGFNDRNRLSFLDKDSSKAREGFRIEIIKNEFRIDTSDGPLRVISTERSFSPLNIGIVMVPGSNWETAEDETFRAENLAALGFTVFTFDKRGHGGSPGAVDRPFHATARDVGWVHDWAISYKALQIDRWGVLAISRGGWIAPLIPNFNERFDFAVLSVSPATSPFEQEFSARRAQLKAEGFSEKDQVAANQYFEALIDFARSGDDDDKSSYARFHEEAKSWMPEKFLGGDPFDVNDWRWWRFNGDYEPDEALRKIKVPTLVLLGEKDLSVLLEPTLSIMNSHAELDGQKYLSVHVLNDVGHDLSYRFNGKIWAFDTAGSEGIEEIRQWALSHSANFP